MIARLITALGLVICMASGGGVAAAHDSPASPSSTRDTIDSVTDHDAESKDSGVATELEGTLEVLYEDREHGSLLHHSLLTRDGKRWSLHGVQHHDLLTGDRVRVRGMGFGRKLRLKTDDAEAETQVQTVSPLSQFQTKSTANVQVLQFAPLSSTFGLQKVAILMVNFTNDRSQPTTASSLKSLMAASDAFFREVSYDQTRLTADVHGWYTLPIANTGCPYSTIKTYADKAAVAAGVDLSGYNRRVYFFPYTSACSFSGIGTIGGSPSSAWINGAVDYGLFNHELGHNLGLYHSHSMSCAPAVLGSTCTTQEYGDNTDTMGYYGGHFNAFQKQRLGWLNYDDSPPITTVQESGRYTIDAYELPGTLPKALKIQRGPATAQAFFFVELRTNVGVDRFLPPNSVFVHLASDNNANSSYLLDMTPETGGGRDQYLAAGKSFTDPVSGITIRTVSVSGTSATIDVDMPGTAPSCTSSPASVTASPAQGPKVPPGTAVTYTVSVTNRDSAGCPPASFAFQATAPAGWQKVFAAPSVTISPGATVSTSLRVTSPDVPAGSYPIASTATKAATSTVSNAASVVYSVAPSTSGPGPASPGTFIDRFDRPDTPTLGNSWSQVTGGQSVQSEEARSPLTGALSLAVRPDLLGATQAVEMSFASTNNNTAPRFGVVLRYQDPKNYYLCYRQVGGSSVVRVAKIRNGVETVLKSIGVANPKLNTFSTLSCQASGTTVTLALDGVPKVSVSDGAFSSGYAGYAISSGKGAAHRADNFSASVQ
jgi:hypothetical protein